jgi:hypothetical protein
MAWQTLRDDRHYGDMGGAGRIYFTAIERYASRYDIAGTDFDQFVTIILEMDAEYLIYLNEKAKADQERRDRRERESKT